MPRKCLAFQICCLQSIGNKFQKNRFQKHEHQDQKYLLRTLPKMTGRKWSDIAQYPKWPLCGHRDVNSQWAYSSCRLAKERTSQLLHRRRTIGFSVSVLGRRLPSLRTMYLRRLKRFFVILFVVGCAMRRPFQRCI